MTLHLIAIGILCLGLGYMLGGTRGGRVGYSKAVHDMEKVLKKETK